MDRMDERTAIAAELDAIKRAQNDVNKVPEVIEARRVSDEADRVAEKARRAFRAAFNTHFPREDVVTRRLARKYPGLVIGDYDGGDTNWVVRCALSGLPIFAGDKVFVSGGDDDYQKVHILAEAVDLAPAYAHLKPEIAQAHRTEVPDAIDVDDVSEEEEAA